MNVQQQQLRFIKHICQHSHTSEDRKAWSGKATRSKSLTLCESSNILRVTIYKNTNSHTNEKQTWVGYCGKTTVFIGRGAGGLTKLPEVGCLEWVAWTGLAAC